MTTSTQAPTTTQVYRVHIRATPQAVWDAITDPDWNSRYGYGGRGEFDLRPGGRYVAYTSEAMKQGGRERGFEVPDIAVDGEVIEASAPRRLVLSWRLFMSPEAQAEGFTRLTYDIDQVGAPGVTRLTVTHELEHAPQLALLVGGSLEESGAGGGWAFVLSDLKTLLETGSSLAG